MLSEYTLCREGMKQLQIRHSAARAQPASPELGFRSAPLGYPGMTIYLPCLPVCAAVTRNRHSRIILCGAAWPVKELAMPDLNLMELAVRRDRRRRSTAVTAGGTAAAPRQLSYSTGR